MHDSSIDPNILAKQLRKPEGAMGEQVGKVMAEMHMQAIAFTFEHLHLQHDDHVLEIGFGPGEAIAEAVRLTPKGFVAGVDFSQTMLDMAEKRNKRALIEDRAELTLGEAKELPYRDESFDAVFAMNVFHFWPKPSVELKEILRVLKPGGRVLFFLTHHSAWFPGFDKTGIFIPYEPADVEKILRDAGFRNVNSDVRELDKGKCFVVEGVK